MDTELLVQLLGGSFLLLFAARAVQSLVKNVLDEMDIYGDPISAFEFDFLPKDHHARPAGERRTGPPTRR